MRLPIRYQLLIPLASILLLVVGIGSWLAVDSSLSAARRQIEDQLRATASTLARIKYPLTIPVLGQVKSFSGFDFWYVDGAGRVVTTLPAEVRTQVPKDAIVADDTREKVRPLQIGSISYLTINVELERLCEKCGGPLLLLHETQTWPRATLETLRPVLWWTVGGTIVSLLVVTVIASRFSRRIREVRRRTRTIVGGNYEPMPLAGCNDELRDLCLAVNQMAGELAMFSERLATTERLRLLGQIGGGLAHQLRNGVAGARLAVQVHMRERPQEADAEPLRVALTQLELVERRVRGFLDLGSGQPGEQVLLSLTRLVDETVQLFHPRCRHANVQLEWTRPEEPCMLEGETGRLQQLVVNLIDNAIDAAGAGRDCHGPFAPHWAGDGSARSARQWPGTAAGDC